jgi:hypothetical protein
MQNAILRLISEQAHLLIKSILTVYLYDDLSGNFRSKVLNASVLGVKGCLRAVGVRGGTFLISHAFSPETSDVGDPPRPSRRAISSLASLRFAFCSFVGNMDQMAKTRLMNKKDLAVSLA